MACLWPEEVTAALDDEFRRDTNEPSRFSRNMLEDWDAAPEPERQQRGTHDWAEGSRIKAPTRRNYVRSQYAYGLQKSGFGEKASQKSEHKGK